MSTDPRLREISVGLDPIDAIYIVAALAEMEHRWKDTTISGSPVSLTGRAERCRRVRIALEQALYGSAA